MAKETNLHGKRDLLAWRKRPTYMAKDLIAWEKRPTSMAKETYQHGKRDPIAWHGDANNVDAEIERQC